MNLDRLKDLLNLSTVPRWVVVPHHGRQSVADHSFRVAAIAYELGMALNNQPIAIMSAMWALRHDGSEAITGDIPAPIKDQLTADERKKLTYLAPWHASLNEIESGMVKQVVKLADLLEGYTFIQKYGIHPRAGREATGMYQQALDIARELDLMDEFIAILHTIMD